MTKKAREPDAGLVDEVLQNCLLTRTRSIARVITSIYDNALRSYGVNASQFSMLVRIARMNGASRAELGRANHQERSTSTRNLQLLLDEGWVEEVVPERGRSRPIILSPAGRALMENAMPAWREAQAAAKKMLGREGAEALLSIAGALPSESA
ncbi:MarR family winged helix-turn-helix transcriptional regulator [Pseudoduganella rhizocola]|uniref:MarR family winged helix-turn-helix transcriptional regulator n=1 Tax=Pseudoduganella rhizocola TaxID=3382643 RepID=UPI0038B64C24